MSNRLSRRKVLQSSAAMAAAATLPDWFISDSRSSLRAADSEASERPGIALVGCGGRGRGVAKQAAEFGRMVAVCDVDDSQLAAARKIWPDAVAEKDFRRVVERNDVEVVVCGTVDHWHALVSSAAMRAGKDVYCEKPLTLTVDEGKRLVEVAEQTGRILQTGSQQRSDANFRLACELVRNGRLGKLQRADVFLPAGRREGPFQPSPVPTGFDWDMWLGPTSVVDYVKQRTHGTFRYWWDYSGGTMTDWGAHHNDIVLWGIGLERSGPVAVQGEQLVEMIPNGFTAASEYRVEYRYANGVVHTCQSTTASAWNGRVVDPNGQLHGVRFTGSDGWVWVTRGAIEASSPEILVEPFASDAIRLPVSDNHMANFFACVRDRSQPICDVEIGHRSASLCHLGVIAIRLGRELHWDPDAETFVDDAEATGWLARVKRGDWQV